jgi:hypothetical protein
MRLTIDQFHALQGVVASMNDPGISGGAPLTAHARRVFSKAHQIASENDALKVSVLVDASFKIAEGEDRRHWGFLFGDSLDHAHLVLDGSPPFNSYLQWRAVSANLYRNPLLISLYHYYEGDFGRWGGAYDILKENYYCRGDAYIRILEDPFIVPDLPAGAYIAVRQWNSMDSSPRLLQLLVGTTEPREPFRRLKPEAMAILDRKVDELQLPKKFRSRFLKLCTEKKIIYIGQVIQHWSLSELIQYPGIGYVTLRAVERAISNLGLSVGMPLPDWKPPL